MAFMGILMFAIMIAYVVCHFILLIDAFKNELWKGIVALLIPLYTIYYGYTEYDQDNRTIVLTIYTIGFLIIAITEIYGFMNTGS